MYGRRSAAQGSIVAVGGTRSDYVHVSYGYDVYRRHGPALWAEKIKSDRHSCFDLGNPKRQVQIMRDYGSPDILCCTPSLCHVYRLETVRDMGIDPKTLKLRAGGTFWGRTLTEEMRCEIERLLAIRAYDI